MFTALGEWSSRHADVHLEPMAAWGGCRVLRMRLLIDFRYASRTGGSGVEAWVLVDDHDWIFYGRGVEWLGWRR